MLRARPQMANKPLDSSVDTRLTNAPDGDFATVMANADILVVAGQEVGGEMSSLLGAHKTACGSKYVSAKGSIKSVLTLGKMDQKIHVAVRSSVCAPGSDMQSSALRSGSVCLGVGKCNKGINWVSVELCSTGKKLLLISGHLPMDGTRTADFKWDLGYGEGRGRRCVALSAPLTFALSRSQRAATRRGSASVPISSPRACGTPTPSSS